MAKLSYFNRHAKLTIKFYKQDNPAKSDREVIYEHYIPLNNTKVYNNVRIAFDIQKYPSRGLDCNGTAKIMVYNISDEVNDLLADESLVKEAKLEVGYGDKIETIYSGYINTNYVSYQNNDMITYLWCFSFSSVLLDINFDEPYPFKTPTTYLKALETVIDELSRKTSVKLKPDYCWLDKKTMNELSSKKIENITVTGLKDMLKKIEKDFSCDYYIEDKIIYLASFKEKKENGLVQLSPQNGLLNNPNVTNSGLEIKTILNPKIQMFCPIKVMSEFADYSGDGYYFNDVVKKLNTKYLLKFKSFYLNSQAIYVSHVGDTHENLWETRVTTITLNESINPKAIKVV